MDPTDTPAWLEDRRRERPDSPCADVLPTAQETAELVAYRDRLGKEFEANMRRAISAKQNNAGGTHEV